MPYKLKGKELFEILATIEHERWADWQRYMMEDCFRETHPAVDEDGMLTLKIPAKQWEAWKRQINTMYADLSEKEKKSDREQVDRYWSMISPDQRMGFREPKK